MADRPNQGSPDSSNYEQIAFAVIMVIVAVIVQIMSFMHLWIRPTEQTVTAQGNTKGSRVTIGKSSYASKLKKRMYRPRPINVEINSAMIGNENITVLGSASPPLIEGRNKDPTRIMQNTVSMWEKQAGDIFVTNGLENVRDASMKKNLLIITGPQGSGKSTALRYASVTLKENGYIVYPCTKPSEIVYYWDDTKKQVFVIDDPVGRECVSLISVHKLEKHKESIKHCIEGHTTKVILAVRSEIINDKFVSSSKTLLTRRQNEVDLTDDEHTLSEQERKDMLSHYLSRNGVHGNFSLQMPNLHCFPLLCHAFCKVGPIRRNPTEFFSSPFSVIKDTFIRMREQNPPHFCALALCAVCENKLSNRDLGPDSSNRDKVDLVMALLGMNRMTEQKRVSNAMDALNGVYFTRNGKSYTFLHSLFEDIVTFILGEESTVFLFKYCSSTFLRSHVKIVDTRANAGEHVIMLERSEYKDLAERMCQELRKNNIEDIFYHSALGKKHFLKIFMNECSKDKIVEYANEMNIPLLAWSCRVEMFRLTLALLKEGAALNICDETKRSALMWVCRNNFRAKDQICDIAKRLLNAGADARLIDNRNYNALLYAIRKGDVHIVRDLLAHGACVKEVSSKLSPLSMAVKSALKHKRTHFESAPGQNQSDQYSTKIVTLLLEHGADPNFGDAGDKTMLYQSVSHSNIAISKCLLQHGADVGLSNTLNEDLLCCAISNCSLELVELLLDKNVSVNKHDGFSKSPLHLAVIKDNSDLVTLLIKRGACVNSKDSEGETPLHLSVKGKKEAITYVLLRNGADVQAEDKHGKTPQHWNIKTYAEPNADI